MFSPVFVLKLKFYFQFLSFFEASSEAPDVSYESIQCTRIRLDDNPTCNIGIHFDLVADKIGELIVNLHCNTGPSREGDENPY